MFLAGATLHATPDLDVYVFGGQEAETAKRSPSAASSSATATPTTSTPAAWRKSPPAATALTCTGNVKSVDQITAGFWDKVYSGPFGFVRVGVQYSHTDLDTFGGADAAGHVGALPRRPPTT